MSIKRSGGLLPASGLALALFLGMACTDDDDGTDATAVPPTIAADSGEATTPSAESDEESQSEADFAIEVTDRLTELQNQLAELESGAANLGQEARAELEPMLEDLRDTMTTLENRLIDLQATPEGSDREAVKQEIEDTLDQAQAQIDEIQDAVGI